MNQSQENSENLNPSEIEQMVSDKASTMQDTHSQEPNSKLKTFEWLSFVPFVLSAVFYLSAVLALLAPFPLLLLFFRKGRVWAWAASLVNAGIVLALGGWLSCLLYFTFILVASLVLAESLSAKKSLEKSVFFSLLSITGVGFGFLLVYAQMHHVNPFQEIYTQVSVVMEEVAKSPVLSTELTNPGDLEQFKQAAILELPSVIVISSLMLVFLNLVLLLRANPAGLRESLGIEATYFKKWKAPEFLVWPTVVSGFFLLVEFGLVSDVCLTVFKFLMAIYAIQGLSILSYVFDIWGVRGFFRILGYSLSLFLMMPLVLSLGFFDLWFDFRGKFRQS